MNKVKRLYEQFQPSAYKLSLDINEDSMSYTGTVLIEGKKVGRPSQRITFHQKGLNVHNVTITHKDKTGHVVKDIARINAHNSFDEVRIHSNQTLYPGHYAITLEFSGTITTAMNGIYPCFYQEKGVKKQLIATQFESHHAREVFPCIDEPEAKAIFNLEITSRHTTVLSNTPVITQKTLKNKQITTFEPTPIMSTYLLAFVIGDMKYKESKTSRGIAVRTYTTPDNIEFTDFALDTAIKCIDFYEDYFGIEYPLTKSDLIALPDFASGAMENWGCITFREQCMLVDPNNTSIATKQYVAMVVAHELAHMWFGNLVTMRWWQDLWLNEGFASWIEYLAIDKLFPDWQMWTQFIVDEQQQAMKLDSLDNTHPIEVPVHHPDEIRTIFDAISYSKGASVIHQLHSYIGADNFKKGINKYLSKHAYKNTDTKDLWAALSEASGKDVASFMHNWTSKPGYPILNVSKSKDTLTITQERFYSDSQAKLNKNHTWPIPLNTGLAKLPELLTDFSNDIKLDTTDSVLFNKGRGGFYRTSYDKELLDLITPNIKNKSIEPLDRLGLLLDILETSKSGKTSTVDAIQLLNSFSDETNAVVWTAIASLLGSIRLVHGNDELRKIIKPFIINLVKSEYDRLGWDESNDDSYFDKLERPIILGLLASADNTQILSKCHDLFDQAYKDVTTGKKQDVSISPDMRSIVFSTVARNGDAKTFDKLLQMHNIAHLSEEKLNYAAALTDFCQPELINKALELIKTDTVRHQDVSYWLAYSFSNHHARNASWEWLKENWEWLKENLGNDLSFSRTPIYAARTNSSKEFAKQYIDFFVPRLNPGLERSYKQGLEIISWQSEWKNRDQKAIIEYFTNLLKK
ncbi:MAG: M1 family metallopeptidase [bacterium]